MVLFLTLLLTSCGQIPAESPVQGANILRADKISERIEQPAGVYRVTAICLQENFGYAREEIPILYEMERRFNCGDHSNVDGCALLSGAFAGIYIYTEPQAYSLRSYLIAHEAIHYISGLGNEAHGNRVFAKCEWHTGGV